jgi:hypothetical protein
VVGGWEAATPQSAVVAALEVYDPATDSWSSGADLLMPRALLAASALGGELYAIGGGSAALGEFNTALVHRYDAEADTWSQAASLPTARGSLAAVTVGERIFAVGGGFNTPGLATVEIYDADSDAWSPASPMPTARWGVTGSVVNGRLYAVGGSTQVGAAHNAVVTNETYQALAFNINPGLNDAWYQQATSGQGFFIIVLPDTGIIFMAWFTFDTDRPDQNVAAMLGEPGHRWLTAQGPFLGDTAVLDVYLTEGGVFDAGTPKPETGTPIGTITSVWQDCAPATLTYEIDPPGVMGVIPITRIAPDNVALCEAFY